MIFAQWDAVAGLPFLKKYFFMDDVKVLIIKVEFYDDVLKKELKPKFRSFVNERLNDIGRKIIELTLNK